MRECYYCHLSNLFLISILFYHIYFLIFLGLPGQPSSLSSKSVSSTKIVISWSAPTDEGDGITGYSVKWKAAEESKIYQKEVTGNRSVTLDKLTPYTWYDIHVRAESRNGDGPWSVPLKVRTKESSEF